MNRVYIIVTKLKGGTEVGNGRDNNTTRKDAKSRYGKARLMLLGNGEYLAQMAKKYGPDVTLKEVIEKEEMEGGKEDGKHSTI